MPGWRSQCRLVLLNSLTCGLEICVAAGITYVPPLLLEAGVEEQYMTMVLGIGPVLGLIFIPVIGSASDHCNSSYGRRRPFIWLLSLGVLLALLIIPHADLLAAYFTWGGRTLEVAFLILGVGLLDFCGQVCFTPLEALLSDLYRDEEDCNQAFAMFSFMVSLGGCVGYLLPALDWSRGLLSVYLGGQAECLFFMLILIFVTSVLITMKVSEEPPCAGVPALEPAPLLEAGHCSIPRSCCYLLKCKLRLLKSGPLLCLLRTFWSMTPAIYHSYCHVPQVMRQLCVAQLCSWMAVMSFMLFYTDFVGEGLYEGVPSAAPGTASRQRYDDGIRMGSLGLFLQCATSTVFSLLMSRLVRHFGSRRVYLSSMVSFTISALVICMSKSVVLVTVMSALTGFAYATLQTLPYTLTCHYHKEMEVYMPKKKTKNLLKYGIVIKQDSITHLTAVSEEAGLAHKLGGTNGHAFFSQDGSDYYPPPHGQNGSSHKATGPEQDEPEGYEKRGVGLDFAILDSTFLLSQVFPTLFMGMIVQFTKSVTAYMASSAIFGIIAIYLANHIIFDQKDLKS
ncbi:solute carrier family 45 member 3-like isoform 1-T3 [Salvelinus alpinus]|uniref:solute carrier family 45 member 3 n=1 Tax=Salvelinus sp. IW2-2015 TaxID=2691554 RepID=UPI000CDF9B2E|nr:solute carrier family 45 member 3 [Salvelinus alpinus]XP_023826651.1 solute carrier family 45 member 3 [Salvelinus alpinus]XP_023826652.1 solute carrier family 45 member 3 [Salvelinus alpinus]XP_055795684.1 solute carrier family 45 member 3 [Salvelinus fontinalis]